MIDVIIPTMWVNETKVLQRIQSYLENPVISKVIVISNAKRSNTTIIDHDKLVLIDYGRNIYVNPAWNEGYACSSASILALINDDIDLQPEVFQRVLDYNLQTGDLLGVDLRGYANNYKIDDVIDTPEEIIALNIDRTKDIGGQAWAFGICMFMRRSTYKPIPSLFQIWYGDDFLVQHSKRILVLRTNLIKGSISDTLVKYDLPNSDIRRRRELDTINYKKYRLKLEYEQHRTNTSDINEHLELLYNLANECSTVTEFGVRHGSSTRAFLSANIDKLIAYDLHKDPSVEKLFKYAHTTGKNVSYIQANVLEIQIEPTDLLFIDTLHTYDQLRQELQLHATKVNKYIVFHDTHTFGTRGELSEDRKGLLPALIEFCISNPQWRFKLHRTNNNGLTVIERKNEI